MSKIKSQYDDINIIGKNNASEELMNNNISDLNIAKYCLKNNCDLITADTKSYIDWFNAYTGIDKLIISKFDYWNEGQRPILLIQIKDSGTSILLVEQNAKKSLAISDRCYVLAMGKNFFDGKASEVINNQELGRMFLGSK